MKGKNRIFDEIGGKLTSKEKAIIELLLDIRSLLREIRDKEILHQICIF